ncbi:MAG: response regulator transcription factor [Anaerolineales bacterium]|nr:response regulator transcription factor [Anaerolineales bacterium]
MGNKILIVEDNEAVALGLRFGFEKEDFTVLQATTAKDGRKLAPRADIILLDVRLPDSDGFELCRQLRAANLRQPILMLTAKDDLIDKIIGLEVGADDYMTKPFELREVVARIRALLRRAYGTLSTQETAVMHIGSLIIDLSNQRVMRNEEEIHLTSTEFKLLTYLAQQPNRIVDRQTLIEQVWGYEYYFGDQRTVDVHVRNLRQKIEINPHIPDYIVTVRGQGYKLATESSVP